MTLPDTLSATIPSEWRFWDQSIRTASVLLVEKQEGVSVLITQELPPSWR